jgi:methylated-DNA-[protein]-cysteine S-methyltransferase
MRWIVLDSPLGEISVAADEAAICGFSFTAVDGAEPAARTDSSLLHEAAGQIDDFFAGKRTAFDRPLSMRRGSAFERAVWRQLSLIPYGQTRTYGQVAAAVGEPDAARAVGVACNRNPIGLIVPCHRVIGADGKLVGFGGGLNSKRILLELEARVQMELDWR